MLTQCRSLPLNCLSDFRIDTEAFPRDHARTRIDYICLRAARGFLTRNLHLSLARDRSLFFRIVRGAMARELQIQPPWL